MFMTSILEIKGKWIFINKISLPKSPNEHEHVNLRSGTWLSILKRNIYVFNYTEEIDNTMHILILQYNT